MVIFEVDKTHSREVCRGELPDDDQGWWIAAELATDLAIKAASERPGTKHAPPLVTTPRQGRKFTCSASVYHPQSPYETLVAYFVNFDDAADPPDPI